MFLKIIIKFYKKKIIRFSVFCKVFFQKPYTSIVGISYLLIWVITEIITNFEN